MLSDLRLAARRLRREPGFSLLAVVILALGLGASTAMFSLVDALVLRSLPYPDADRLVRLYRTTATERTLGALAPAALREYRAESATLEDIGTFAWREPLLEEPGEPPELLWGLGVNAPFFGVLRVPPVLGRTFTAEEEQPGRAGVAVISNRLWQGRFGGDPGIVGRTLRLDGQPVTVIGVMPDSFQETPRFWGRADVWLPHAPFGDGHENVISALARLAPGGTLAAAQAELAAIGARVDATYHTGSGVRVASLREREGVDETGRVAWLTMGLAVLLLVVACINLAGLQLGRMVARGHERAIRLALGARRRHLVRLAMAESLLLALAGAGVGLLVAAGCTSLLAPRVLVTGSRPITGIAMPGALEPRVLAFALVLALLTALAVGMAPALLGARAGVAGGRTTTDRRQPRLRRGLVVAEMALALLLLTVGGLFLRGLDRFQRQDQGWKVDGLLTARLTLAGPRYAADGARRAFLIRLRQRLAALPGVEGSALANELPLGEFFRSMPFRPDGATGTPAVTSIDAVSPEYFATLGMTLREGRLLTDADGTDTIVINETMARELFPRGSAIGRRIASKGGESGWLTIVGVVNDVRFPASLHEPRSRFQAYGPITNGRAGITIALRAASEALARGPLVAHLRRTLAELDPALPAVSPITARASVERYLSNFLLLGKILLSLAGLGLLLSALGVYGLFSGFVTERTREIGVRMALGAQRGAVLRLVLRGGLRLALTGAVLGAGAALAVAPLLTSTIEALPARDPWAIALLALALVGVALLACWLPARRAAALEPAVALRHD